MTLTLTLTTEPGPDPDPNPNPDQVCSAARALGRVLKPGGRALIASIPKETCGVTQDVEWDCPYATQASNTGLAEPRQVLFCCSHV